LTNTRYLAEFRTFVENTEKELLSLFKSIDRDHDGRLDKDELRAAFNKAGLTVSSSKLDKFFSEVDQNHDVRLSLVLSHLQQLILYRDIYHSLNGGKRGADFPGYTTNYAMSSDNTYGPECCTSGGWLGFWRGLGKALPYRNTHVN
jgi:hypothetical protein